MQKHLNDLRNPVQSSPAQVGLAASPAHFVQGSTTHSEFVDSSSASLTARLVAFSTVDLSHSSISPKATATPTTTQLQNGAAPCESSCLKTPKNTNANTSQSANLENIVPASRGSSNQGTAAHKLGSVHLGFRSVSDWLRIASTRPDSLIPSRMATLINQYVNQKPKALTSIDIATQNTAARKNASCTCISIGSLILKKSCPFSADSCIKREALEGAPLAGKASGAGARSIPHGNHGDNLRSVQK